MYVVYVKIAVYMYSLMFEAVYSVCMYVCTGNSARHGVAAPAVPLITVSRLIIITGRKFCTKGSPLQTVKQRPRLVRKAILLSWENYQRTALPVWTAHIDYTIER